MRGCSRTWLFIMPCSSRRAQRRKLLQRALRLSPDDPAIQLLAAKVQVQFGQYPAAMAALERSRKLGTSAFVVRDDPEFRSLASELHYQSVARP